MTDRKSPSAAMAAVLAAPLVRARAGGAQASRGPEHYVPGGTRGIQRGQFTFTATDSNGSYGTIPIPDTVGTFMIPLTETVFDESAGAKYRLQGDGVLTVLKDDLYDLTANLDWPGQARGSGQDGYDSNMRRLLLLRIPVGVAPPAYTPGHVTRLGSGIRAYGRLAAHVMPGSSVPDTVRTSVEWAPGRIASGAMKYVDVTLPVGSFTPTVGDLVRVSHASLTDAVLGARNIGLLLSARMVAECVARVMIENSYNAGAVDIPSGTMNVLAQSAVSTAGNNGDTWEYLCSGQVDLLAGEKLMVAVRSLNPGDFLQIVNGAFLRISNIVP